MSSRPLAYFITFRCYGTWLHGDARGSVNRVMPRRVGDPMIPPTPDLEDLRATSLKCESVELSLVAREVVQAAIQGVCDHRDWHNHATHARSNPVHTIVTSSDRSPEVVMNTFKTWATRRLVEAGIIAAGDRVWSRHGSTIYLWTTESLLEKINYVKNGQ